MLQRLQKLSRFTVLGAFALYACGFLCVEAYLSRFGIVTFDIVNARFAIAGLLLIISLSAPAFVAACMLSSGTTFAEFGKKPWEHRIRLYFIWLVVTLSISTILSRLFDVFDVQPTFSSSVFVFHPLFGKYDVVGNVINSLPPKPVGIAFVIKYSLYGCIILGLTSAEGTAVSAEGYLRDARAGGR